ncbi:MAG: hypothetical protein ACYTAF_04855 [Planctomycetota bacterium]|jgi:hypothetical protein
MQAGTCGVGRDENWLLGPRLSKLLPWIPAILLVALYQARIDRIDEISLQRLYTRRVALPSRFSCAEIEFHGNTPSNARRKPVFFTVSSGENPFILLMTRILERDH